MTQTLHESDLEIAVLLIEKWHGKFESALLF